MRGKIDRIKNEWSAFRHSSGFHNALVFVVFVVIAALFWLIMALNDSVQNSFEVRLNITNVPDSVTFIDVPPAKMHVVVRDKGTSLLRNVVLRHPKVNMNFPDMASDGIFRASRNDIVAALKNTFGNTAQISAISVDSLRLAYTNLKGKRVPVVVVADVSASSGNMISAHPKSAPGNVLVYSTRDVLDTVTRVFTQKIIKRNLSETMTVEVPLIKLNGARIIPRNVNVTIEVEPLVSKQSKVDVVVRNVPHDKSLLLFPSKVNVAYYVPIDRKSVV